MKSIGGFYYVRADGEDYECKARGSFRKSGNSPVAGDRVNISVPNDGFCAIEEILPRKNKLRRPALANLDILLLVCSTVEPLPNFTIIDKMTAAAVNNNMEPVIVVTKNDFDNGAETAEIYTDGVERVLAVLSGEVTAIVVEAGFIAEVVYTEIEGATGGVHETANLLQDFQPLRLGVGAHVV